MLFTSAFDVFRLILLYHFLVSMSTIILQGTIHLTTLEVGDFLLKEVKNRKEVFTMSNTLYTIDFYFAGNESDIDKLNTAINKISDDKLTSFVSLLEKRNNRNINLHDADRLTKIDYISKTSIMLNMESVGFASIMRLWKRIIDHMRLKSITYSCKIDFTAEENETDDKLPCLIYDPFNLEIFQVEGLKYDSIFSYDIAM